jgi:hypothetical protein
MLLHCDDEEPSIGDYLEISATILGGLGADVQATSADGEITIDFYPHVDNPKEFLLEYFTPVANYTYATIVDDSEDFEFDIDDAYIGLDELKKLYHFSFFCDSYRILNLDAIVDMDTEGNNKRRPVSDRGPAVSPLLSVRTFDKPTDRISLTIIEIIRFFKSSFRFEEDSDGYEEEEPDIEEMLQEMMIHINEYPDEEEEAREHFEEQSRGYLYDFEFIVESAVYRDLGIKSVEELGNGWLRTVLSPPTNQLAYLNKMGFTPESDDFHDPFAEEEPRGLVRLGLFESVFFTPDEDEETD